MSIFEYDEEKHLNQEREAAYRKGKSDGIELKLFLLVCKKLAKGNTVEQIAEALEESVDVIHTLCEKAAAYAPEYDEKKITEDWRSTHS